MEIWNAQATLLLPLEPQPVNEPITPEFIKDHIAFWDGSSIGAPVVTLSGIRGTMAEYVLRSNRFYLSILSSLHSKYLMKLLDVSQRGSDYPFHH